MATLAIIGHATRDKEVIKILEMLGGNNKNGWKCKDPQLVYYTDDTTSLIEFINTCNPNENILRYTLEEFLEKYPYKIGDRVIARKPAPIYESEICISKMFWNGNEVLYGDEVEWYSANELSELNKEETFEGDEDTVEKEKKIIGQNGICRKVMNFKIKKEM